MRPMPRFVPLWEGYPTGSSDYVKKKVGGGAAGAWVENTCVIRMSTAFHHAGHPIPRNHPGLETTYDSHKRRLAFRVAEFARYLRQVYGPPTLTRPGGNPSAVASVRGVIQFEVDGWSDATGHFDMWNGREPKYAEFFARSRLVHVWRCP